MNIKTLLAVGALALAVGASTSVYAANSATSAAASISLTLAGTCTITDLAAGDGTFANGLTFKAATLSKSANVTVHCDQDLPFRLGARSSVIGGARVLTDAAGNGAPIPYAVKDATGVIGDANIGGYDTTYVSSNTDNAHDGVGTGADQQIPITFEATVPAGQISGTYTDTVAFVVAWP